MSSFFLSIFNTSVTAAIVAVAVILLRFLFKKAPRWLTCLLWALVGLRIVFPFSIESEFSLIPITNVVTVDTSAQNSVQNIIRTDTYIFDNTIKHPIEAMTEPHSAGLVDVLAFVWIFVVALMLIYGVVSYIRMHLRVSTAVPLKKNIYQSENVKSPFVLGLIKPRIYIPFNVSGRTLKYVLAHEEAHIKRKDHIVKPFAYLILCFHWFNPLIWISYILLCRDIEIACDEKVIKDFSINKRKDYAFALLKCKVNRNKISVCPVAFGEVDVKQRIRKTLSYKKPAMWMVATAVAVGIIASGCLLTNPKAQNYSIDTYIVEYEPVSHIEAESFLPEIPSETTAYTENITETAVPCVTDVSVAEVQTETVTDFYEEYYEEGYYSDEYEEEPFTVISFSEFMKQKIAEEQAKAEEERIQRLLKSTSNHSDECMCSDCDDLRNAGYYPMVIPIPEDFSSVGDYSFDVDFTMSMDLFSPSE